MGDYASESTKETGIVALASTVILSVFLFCLLKGCEQTEATNRARIEKGIEPCCKEGNCSR